MFALAFTIRTAARTGEVVGATVDEGDRDAMVWTVPAERMKAGVAHTVPLDEQMLALVDRARERDEKSSYLFPGTVLGKPLSNMAMLQLIRGMGTCDERGQAVTVYGFRSTFRQWVAECTNFPGEIAEHALAHRLKDKTEAAYQRGTLLAKRRRLMNEWAIYISQGR